MILNTVDQNDEVIRSDTMVQDFSWKEFDLDLIMNVPLVFSTGKYTQTLKPTITYTFHKLSADKSTPEGFFQGDHYQSLAAQLFFQNLLNQPELAIFPRWGQAAEVFYRSTPFGGIDIGEIKAIHAYLFFPGLMRNHGIRVYNGYQERKNTEAAISFSDPIRYPRGSQRFRNSQMYSLAVDYAFPIVYPDISLGLLTYLKRIRASLFYDYAHLKGNIYDQDGHVRGKYSGNLEGLGLDLYGDGHFLRLVAPISAGLRSIYRPNTKDFAFEFLFSIGFDDI